jgi:hypothetical protein
MAMQSERLIWSKVEPPAFATGWGSTSGPKAFPFPFCRRARGRASAGCWASAKPGIRSSRPCNCSRCARESKKAVAGTRCDERRGATCHAVRSVSQHAICQSLVRVSCASGRGHNSAVPIAACCIGAALWRPDALLARATPVSPDLLLGLKYEGVEIEVGSPSPPPADILDGHNQTLFPQTRDSVEYRTPGQSAGGEGRPFKSHRFGSYAPLHATSILLAVGTGWLRLPGGGTSTGKMAGANVSLPLRCTAARKTPSEACCCYRPSAPCPHWAPLILGPTRLAVYARSDVCLIEVRSIRTRRQLHSFCLPVIDNSVGRIAVSHTSCLETPAAQRWNDRRLFNGLA